MLIKTAIVTGASSGIGAAVKRQLETRGVAVGDFSRHAGVDVTDVGAVARAFARYAELWSAEPGLLVSNAGILEPSDFLDTPVEAWRRTVDVNLTGAFIVCQEFARRHIAAETGGTVILIASTSANPPPHPGYLAYAASKAALVSLGMGLSVALRPYSIKVYTLVLGPVATPLRARLYPEEDPRSLLQSEDVAYTVEYLAESGAYLDANPITMKKYA